MDVGNEGKKNLRLQNSGFDSLFLRMAMQEAKQIGEKVMTWVLIEPYGFWDIQEKKPCRRVTGFRTQEKGLN